MVFMFRNRVFIFIIVLLLIYLIISSIRSILELQKAGQTVLEYEKEYQEAKKKNEELKERLREVQRPEFIEREAREKLGMGKPGELIIIIPEITLAPERKKERNLANWEKWWKLFF